MKIRKVKVSVLFRLILALVLIPACSLGKLGNDGQGADPSLQLPELDVGSRSLGGGYVWGLPYISQSAKDYGQDGRLQAEYFKWRDKYVTEDGCGMEQLRVARDFNSQYDTVSEGIGYGMLLAVYFNDQNTFDQIYRYCKSHFIKINGNTVNLMHWKQDVSGTNVSEFADYNVDYSVMYINGVENYSQSAAIPHGAVFGNLVDGTVFITPAGSEGSALLSALDNNPNYYRMFKKGNDRGYSSATDGDEDIAAALAFASKVWGSNSDFGIDYYSEARSVVKAIQQYEFTTNGFIKAGNTWGDNTCWNPSYFTPAYYLNVYAAICPEDTSFWQKAYTTMYAEMYKVQIAARNLSGSNSKIFFPDWCDSSNFNISSNPRISKGKLSDRIYYKDGQQSDITINDGMKCPLSAMWKAGTTKDQYTATNMMSFNSYYDAVRVPWRLATDYLWDSKSMWIPNGLFDIKYYSGNLLNYVYNSFAAKWGPNYVDIKDGYTIAGDTWYYGYRDGFNVNTGSSAGGKYATTEFVSMTATTELRKGGTPPATSAHFDFVVAKNAYNDTGDGRGGNYGYNYYGNTLRLLSLVMLTGKFENLYNAPPANGTLVRIYNKKQSNWFLNIENRISHVVECHDGSMDWWSAKWTINRNAEGYYTFKNKWSNGLGYDPYLHSEDKLATAEWDKVTTGSNKGKAPDAGMYSAQWSLIQSQDTGYFVLKNRLTGKILTIRDMIPAANGLSSVKVQTTDSSWGNADRQWRFEIVQ